MQSSERERQVCQESPHCRPEKTGDREGSCYKPELLLLDETAAGLNPSELDEAIDLIRKIRDSGITILMIEHVMRAVMNVSDRILALDYGQQIAEGTPEEIARHPKVIEAYLGDPRIAESLSSGQAREEQEAGGADGHP